MEEFLYKHYIFICHVPIFISIVAGFFYNKKYSDRNKKFFLYFLIFILIQSNLGSYTYYFWRYDETGRLLEMIQGTFLQRNYWWFNIFWHLLSVCGFAYYYWKILKRDFHRKILKIVIVVYVVSALIYYFFNPDDFLFRTAPFVAINQGIVILFCVTLYFLELLQSDKILGFYKLFDFYLSIGILLFWLIKTPLVFFEIYYRDYDTAYVALRIYINIFVIYFMYGMITLGFIIDKSNGHHEISN